MMKYIERIAGLFLYALLILFVRPVMMLILFIIGDEEE